MTMEAGTDHSELVLGTKPTEEVLVELLGQLPLDKERHRGQEVVRDFLGQRMEVERKRVYPSLMASKLLQ